MDELITIHYDINNLEVTHFFLDILNRIINVGVDIKKKILYEVIDLTLSFKHRSKSKNSPFEEDSLFYRIFKISQIEEFREIIQECLFKIENQLVSKQSKIDFYTFIYELNSENWTLIPDEYLYKREKQDDFLNLKDEDLLLFTHFNYAANFNEIDFLSLISNQVDIFGISSIFESSQYRFRLNTRKNPVFSIYLSQNEYVSISKIKQEIEFLNKIGVTIIIITRFLKKSNEAFRLPPFRDNKIKNLIQLYIKNTDRAVDEFLSLILSALPKEKLLISKQYSQHPKLAKILN